MAKNKRTGWIPMTSNPVRDGQYEFIYTGILYGCQKPPTGRAIFKSGKWYETNGKFKLTGLNQSPKLFNWRGLASDPSAK